MYCRKCGTLLKPGERICSLCGTEIPSPVEVYETVSEGTPIPDISPSAAGYTSAKAENAELPLYGYESNNTQANESTQPHQAGPAVPAYSIYTSTAPPATVYDGPVRNAVTPQQKPKGNRVGLLIIILIAMFIVLTVLMGNILSVLKDIRYDLYDFSYWYYYSYPDEENSANGAFTPGDNPSSKEPAQYDGIIGEYFMMVSSGNSSGIINLLHPAVIHTLESNGYKPDDFAREIDKFYETYGSFVDDYQIVDVFPYNPSDYAELIDKVGFSQGDLEEYIDLYATANIKKDGKIEAMKYDFDLVKIGGIWYLISVW